MKKERIVLGMSGGVDSAVSAALLMQAGYEVVGVTCVFVADDASDAAVRDAKEVCRRLGISHFVRECSREFECVVVEPFVADYATGLTPSPCVWCNAGCKVPMLIEAARDLECEKVATGHYARVARLLENGRFVIKTALDTTKDQSYMLARLSQEQLARLVLPLGAATKAEVRILAQDFELPVADKPESQDICFIDGGYVDFLKGRGVIDAPGNIVDKTGKVVGRHEGLFRYTVGQRKGIGVAAAEPYYVVDKQVDTNELVVGFKDETLIREVMVDQLTWQAFEQLEEPLECMVKLRYRSRTVACEIEPTDAFGRSDEPTPYVARVLLRSLQPTTAPGQVAVFYEGDTVLGSGVIFRVE